MNPIELKDLKTSAEAGLLGRIAALEAELEAKHQQYTGAVIQLEEARTHGEQYRKNWLALQAATGEDCQLHALDVIREARKDGERLERAREILFAYTDNEITSDPWWCVVRNGSFGRMVVLEGPFFSRERAEGLRNARLYEYGAKSYVFCFSGYRSQHYKDLRSVVGAPARGPR